MDYLIKYITELTTFQHTDLDVFITTGTKCCSTIMEWAKQSALTNQRTVSGYINVCVCLCLVKGDGEYLCDLQPGYLQRETEGKQERPWRGCPVEGQTAQWEKESSLFKTYPRQRQTDRHVEQNKSRCYGCIQQVY